MRKAETIRPANASSEPDTDSFDPIIHLTGGPRFPSHHRSLLILHPSNKERPRLVFVYNCSCDRDGLIEEIRLGHTFGLSCVFISSFFGLGLPFFVFISLKHRSVKVSIMANSRYAHFVAYGTDLGKFHPPHTTFNPLTLSQSASSASSVSSRPPAPCSSATLSSSPPWLPSRPPSRPWRSRP